MLKNSILLTLFVLLLSNLGQAYSPWSPTYKNEKITLHLIPHTHDDAGWLATVEEYYTGIGTPFRECVQCILDSMYQILLTNETRIFNYVEMVFFSQWFYDQTDDMQKNVRSFVKNGQLSFMNGGWVMNDEGCTYYDDIIEQMTIGHQFLKKEFNFTPTVGWQIDPFGHSLSQASLFSQMGFNIFFLERIDYQDFDTRKYEKNLEFLWRGPGLLEENYILTHINYFKYGGNWVMNYCMPDNICDGRIQDSNLTTAMQWVRDQLNYFQTPHIVWQIGSDFTFSTEGADLYNAIEDLQRQINSNPSYKVKAKISTPETYSKDWYQEYQSNPSIKLKIKKDDFFPYADRANNHNEPAYWTGYFTSKSSFKLILKQTSQLMHTFRKIYAQNMLGHMSDSENRTNEDFQKISNQLDLIEKTVAVCQHHDAATGTAKQRVMVDYMMKLIDAMEQNFQVKFFLYHEKRY